MKELYTVIRNGIHPDIIKLVKDSLILTKDADYAINKIDLNNKSIFSDVQCPNSWPKYGHPTNEALSLLLLPNLENIFGVKLYPTYSYCRIYWTGSTMAKHLDRPSCQYSVSVCIDVDPEPWPIWFDKEELILNPGDFVAYRGMEVEHWREEYKGKQQIQVFLHYVDQDGPHAHYIYDKRKCLGIPRELK